MTTNIGVARNWAFNLGDGSSKSGNGNMSHHGTVLYSYSTPIANLVRGAHGHWVALITAETYSLTTEGKHKNAAHKATGYGRELATYVVPFLLLPGGTYTGRSTANRLASDYTPEEQHKANLDAYAQRIAQEEERLAHARVYTDRQHLARIMQERDDYARAFNLIVEG